MIDLVQASMRGLQFHADYYEVDAPVDFAFTYNGMSVVMMANWWATEWAPGDGIEIFQERLLPEVVAVGEEPSFWTTQDIAGVVLSFAEDAGMSARIALAREATDLYRYEYLQALTSLQESLGEGLDITEWIEAVNARPIIDPVKELLAQNTGMRKIGKLFMRGVQDVRDVLVIDEYGNAAVGSSGGWLQVLADQWSEREDRPEMEEFLAWAQEQRVPIPASLEAGQIEMAMGHVDDIALRFLQS